MILDNDFTKDFAGKTALDLRDDLTDAQKILRSTCEERDDLKSEVMKLKLLIERREKEIEDLLMGGHVSQKDRGRLSAASKQDTLLVHLHVFYMYCVCLTVCVLNIICVYLTVHVCVWLYMYTCTCMCLTVHMCLVVHVHVHVHVCLALHVCLYMYVPN